MDTERVRFIVKQLPEVDFQTFVARCPDELATKLKELRSQPRPTRPRVCRNGSCTTRKVSAEEMNKLWKE